MNQASVKNQAHTPGSLAHFPVSSRAQFLRFRASGFSLFPGSAGTITSGNRLQM